jgi:hypothetical protein
MIDLSCPRNRANQRQDLFNDVLDGIENVCDWLEGLATTFTECGDRFDARGNAATKAGHDRQKCGRGAAAREQRLRKFYVVGEHGRRQTFRRHASVALEPWPSFSAPSLLDLISRTPAANLVPRRSGSGRTRSAARSASARRQSGTRALRFSPPFPLSNRSAGTGTRPSTV